MTRTRRLGATLATTLLALVALSLGNPPAGAQPDGVEVTEKENKKNKQTKLK